MDIRRWLWVVALGLPVLEIYVLIRLFGTLGFIATLALLLGAAGLGLSLMRTQGPLALIKIQQVLARGEAPVQEMLESGLVALGGLLLLIPGLISDLLAIACLVPASRKKLAGWIFGRLAVPVRQEADGTLTLEGEYKREK